MKTTSRTLMGCILFLALFLSAPVLQAQTNVQLQGWSFNDTNSWTDNGSNQPISFANINVSNLGDGNALVVDTNVSAWLGYNVVETNGTTNLTVDIGSIMFWFAPDWSSTNAGGSGPQGQGDLLNVTGTGGSWNLYVDSGGNNLYFSTNGLTCLSVPITWTTDRWHYVALTYCSTNVSLYLDGGLATNSASGLSGWSASAMYIGSDNNGLNQAHGMFDDMGTYNYPLDGSSIAWGFNSGTFTFYLNPRNPANGLGSASSYPSTTSANYDAITGQGFLQWIGSASSCSNGTNANNIWITNITASAAGNGTMNVTFTIEGGASGVAYDVFGNSMLGTTLPWAWLGQGSQCNTYTITNLPNTMAFLMLGTPLDSDGDGLSDAYEKLVSKTDPNNADTSGDGISDGWEVLLGLNPLQNNSGLRVTYSYDLADWLEGVSGTKNGAVSLDNEGNVLSISQ